MKGNTKHLTFSLAVLIIASIIVAIGYILPISRSGWERLYFITQVLTLAVLAVSAILVLGQLKQMSDSQAAGHFGEVSAAIIDIQHDLLRNPELYDYFYREADLKQLDQNDQCRALLLAETRLDRFDGILLRYSLFPRSSADEASIRTWIKDCLAASPATQEFLNTHRSWYRPELVNMLDEVRSSAEDKNGASPS